MTNFRRSGLLAAFLSVLSVGYGQPAHDPELPRLGFLSGRWVSESPTEMQEESWSPVNGDSMVGSFRIVQKGRPVFYEFWAVEVDHNRPVLKLKHFDNGLLGWEEKNDATKLPLTSSAENDAVFAQADGGVSLHYHLVGKKLTCTVHHVRNGKESDETFTLLRASGN
jgi:uncharacterized protein DUF6265